MWSKNELSDIAKLCDKYEVKVISDEIHMDISFKPHTPYIGFSKTNNWAVVTSVSKSFNLPALNGAYALLSDDRIYDDYLSILKQRDGLSSPSILGVIGMIAAYNEAEPWLDALNNYVYENHQYLKQRLEKEFATLHYSIPDATYLAWLDLSPLLLDMNLLKRQLVEHFNVAIMSGEVYGNDSKDYLRFNLGCPRSKVGEGITALIGAIRLQL